ncbi:MULTISPECIES: DUF397 domain-containing protein [Streptomyces]|uniref:DUF397 domain-containing protein n=1 Tax=Streptomyces TaxID=1883 RepID=UPI00224964F5|nr:DUF397 domain-containing protein [Streptomyces sp. JHD 1]MCX2967376.1 DUF397 domain-containing protein [Streptomyces sp. JHD 1]
MSVMEKQFNLQWHKSTYSDGSGGDCVEVAACGCAESVVHVRDSKDTARGSLAFTPTAWTAFLAHTAR